MLDRWIGRFSTFTLDMPGTHPQLIILQRADFRKSRYSTHFVLSIQIGTINIVTSLIENKKSRQVKSRGNCKMSNQCSVVNSVAVQNHKMASPGH